MKFDVFVISLASADARRKQISQNLTREGIEWNFFDAIRGDSLGDGWKLFDVKRCLKFPGYPLKPNEIACFLSHREIWKKCIASNKAVLILEDDAIVAEMFKGKLKKTIEKIDVKKIDILRLGNGGYKDEKKKIHEYGETAAFRYREDPLCALAYVLTPKAAEKLLQSSEGFYLAVDNFIWRTDLHFALVLDLYPQLFCAFDGKQSTIGDRRKPSHSIFKKISIEFYRALDRRKQKKIENKIFKEIN